MNLNEFKILDFIFKLNYDKILEYREKFKEIIKKRILVSALILEPLDNGKKS